MIILEAAGLGALAMLALVGAYYSLMTRRLWTFLLCILLFNVVMAPLSVAQLYEML